jgi:uncharacterized membrane protein YphA (DoxX/SURF4 family)
MIAVLAVISGGLLLLGYLTVFASTIAGLNNILLWFTARPDTSLIDSLPLITLELAVPIAIAFLGPGAFSLDARLFGHREIVIPRPPRPLAE